MNINNGRVTRRVIESDEEKVGRDEIGRTTKKTERARCQNCNCYKCCQHFWICAHCGISRETFFKWINKDKQEGGRGGGGEGGSRGGGGGCSRGGGGEEYHQN